MSSSSDGEEEVSERGGCELALAMGELGDDTTPDQTTTFGG